MLLPNGNTKQVMTAGRIGFVDVLPFSSIYFTSRLNCSSTQNSERTEVEHSMAAFSCFSAAEDADTLLSLLKYKIPSLLRMTSSRRVTSSHNGFTVAVERTSWTLTIYRK